MRRSLYYVLIIAVLAGAAWYLYYRQHTASAILGPDLNQEVQAGTAAPTTSPTTLPPTALPNGLMEYTNKYYHFSLEYPSNLAVNEYAEQSGIRTITFQDASTTAGFQISIIPYQGTQITPTRFKLDEPSGVMDQLTNILIDQVPAVMFYSTNSIMGATREVWFIHDGFLYEVVTYKALDGWLAAIMHTWTFI